MVIVVPGPPVGKGRPRFARRGAFVSTYTPAATANYESRVALAAHLSGAPKVPDDVPVSVDVLAVFARPKRLLRASDPDGLIPHLSKPDSDNVLKSVLDGLKAILRDEQVADAIVRKRYAERGGQPRTEITIRTTRGCAAAGGGALGEELR
jgi:Holliday junction resolvase RusA-like endonuclease